MYALEVDQNRARHEARDLGEYLATNDQSVPESVRRAVAAFLDAFNCGRIRLPISIREKPINLVLLEDEGVVLSREFKEVYSRFFNTAVGARVDFNTVVERDGKPYGWMEFVES